MIRERMRGTDDPRDRDYQTLSAEQKRQIDCVVDIARRDRTKAVRTEGEAEFYAYPHARSAIAQSTTVVRCQADRILKCRATVRLRMEARCARGGIAWGINDGPNGFNTKRGVKR